jgi:membrane fusion protein (multidrug efflux system)
MRAIFLFFLISLLLYLSCGNSNQSQLLVPDIPIYQVKTERIPVYQEFVGQIYGQKDIAIRARVEGFLEGIHFLEGLPVKKGELLYTIENQTYEEDVAAKMSKLAEAQTMLAKAESDLNRIKPLAQLKAVSESDLDAAIAYYEAALAGVEAAEANLRASKVQLGYTKVYAPISGIIGKTLAKVGDFVGRSPNPIILNVVSLIDTIRVEFYITETQYLSIARFRQDQREKNILNEKREQISLDLILADGSLYPLTGRVDFLDRDVDPTTGAVLVQASFPNPNQILRPGQFAKIRATVTVLENGIKIPQRCLTELQGLYRVFVVNDSNRVELRNVEVGSKIKNFWLITKGLSEGEKVIYEGLQKVREGVFVNPVIHKIEEVE